MNILITGGAGYIGTELVYALEQDEKVDSIVVYDNFLRSNYNLFLGRSKLNSQKVKFVKGDILDSRKLKKEVDVADVVFHLAAKVSTPFADHNPHEFDQVNNWGTAELTQLVENSNVKKYIYASSVSVYGASDEEAAVDSFLHPKTFYGISKKHAEEHVLRLKDSEMDTYVLRLGNVYGYSKSMRFDSVINKFMFDANFMKRLRIYGDGNQKRSFIQIDRLSNLLKSFALSHVKSDTYNLVENTFSVNEIVDELKNLFPELEMVYVNQNMKMRNLIVKPDWRVRELSNEKRLKEDFIVFKNHFSF